MDSKEVKAQTFRNESKVQSPKLRARFNDQSRQLQAGWDFGIFASTWCRYAAVNTLHVHPKHNILLIEGFGA